MRRWHDRFPKKVQVETAFPPTQTLLSQQRDSTTDTVLNVIRVGLQASAGTSNTGIRMPPPTNNTPQDAHAFSNRNTHPNHHDRLPDVLGEVNGSGRHVFRS